MMAASMAVFMTGCSLKKDKDSDKGNVGKVTKNEEGSDSDETDVDPANYEAIMTGSEYNANVVLPDYKSMKVAQSKAEISEESFKQLICHLLASTSFAPDLTHIGQKEGTVEKYDVVNIDYEGKKDGVAFEGGTAQGYHLGIGTGTFIPGFEDKLIGVKTGETVDLDLTFPESYGNEELAGKDVVFTVKVNYIAELSDEFVADNKDILTYFIYQNFSAYRQVNNVEDVKNAFNEGIKVFNIAPSMFTEIKENTQVNRDETKLNEFVSRRKQVYTEYAETNGMTLEEVLQTYMNMQTEAEFDAYVSDIYDSFATLFAIAKQENISVSEEEYEGLVQSLVNQSNGQFADIKGFQVYYPKQDTVDDLICGKVYYKITEYANLVPDEEIETKESDNKEEGSAEGDSSSEDNESGNSEE